MEEKSEYQNLFSPLNASIPLGMTPFTESLKNTYDRVVPFYENKIKSNKTINLINYFNKNKKNEIFFLMGADNLVNFHKWHKWKQISEKCNILVFDRYGYKKKSLNSKTYKTLKSEKFKFVYFNKVNISSSQLRKI